MLLANGIETIEVGSTAWRVILNSNLEKILTQAQITQLILDNKEVIVASSLPTTGDATKLYINTTDNKTYRWNAGTSAYVEVSPSSGGSGVPELSFVATLPTTGDATKLYINTTDNKTYRWDAGTSAYVEVSPSSGGSGTDELVFTATLPTTGDATKLYINTTDNKTYRWDELTSAYIEVSPSSGGSGTDYSQLYYTQNLF